MAHVYHACIILHAMTDVHAAWHAARVRMDRAQDRSPPRARPGSGLLGGTKAELVRTHTHARLPACHDILLSRSMQHGMQKISVIGAQQSEIGPARPMRSTSVRQSRLRQSVVRA